MVDKEKRNPEINGNKYHVTIAQSKRRQRVSVYEYKSFGGYHESNAIVTNKEWKGTILWFGADQSSPVEEVVRETLNEAVCIRENKLEQQEEYGNRISRAIDSVGEVHE